MGAIGIGRGIVRGQVLHPDFGRNALRGATCHKCDDFILFWTSYYFKIYQISIIIIIITTCLFTCESLIKYFSKFNIFDLCVEKILSQLMI